MARYSARRRRFARQPIARLTNAEPRPSTRPPEPRPQKPLKEGQVRATIEQRVGPMQPLPGTPENPLAANDVKPTIEEPVTQYEMNDEGEMESVTALPPKEVEMPEAPAEKSEETVESLQEMSDYDLVSQYQRKLAQLREGRRLVNQNLASKEMKIALMQIADEVMRNEEEQERRIIEREKAYQKETYEGIFNETKKLPLETLDHLISLARNEEERKEFQNLTNSYKFAVRDRVDREYEYRMADATKFSAGELGIKEMDATLAEKHLYNLETQIKEFISEIERQQARSQA